MQRRHALLAMTLVPAWAHAASPDAPPELLLAHNAPPDIDPAGYLVSEKLDGVRALWDGQRMRLRGGGTVALPAWFAARLPAIALDGELWIARGRFDEVSATVRRQAPDDAAWRAVRYLVFELPNAPGAFSERAARLVAIAAQAQWPALQAVPQTQVPTRAALQAHLNEVVSQGAEGLMLHRADAPYLTGRQPVLLKLKLAHDAEAIVIAHLPGKGRLEGLMGALRVRTPEGREFVLGSGFSDAQRRHPPAIGTVVSYRYRGLTSTGLPRFATFRRIETP
jgi:DNA ligase-1